MKKLKLAGMGDIKRYYDRVDQLKQKFASAETAEAMPTTSGRKCSPSRSS